MQARPNNKGKKDWQMSKKKRTRGKNNASNKEKKTPAPVSQATDHQGRPTISVCMMVKNEENNLPRALESVKDWVDEIIVVDTGSTDRTVEIAESYGAKIYHHLWEHDFSKHRNQSISYATCDWILILDADEELDQETAPHLRQVTTAPKDICGFLFELYNDVSAGGQTIILHPRLFRNHVGFHYEGKVHNRPTVPGSVARTNIRLIHYGYNETPEVMQAKHDRRVSMIRKWAEDEPDNYLAHSYLAHALCSRPESMPEAVEEGLLALQILNETTQEKERYPHVYYPVLNGLANLGRDDELFEHAKNCFEQSPYYPDSVFFIVWVEYKRKDWEAVCDHAKQFIELQQRCRDNPSAFIFFENMTYDQLNIVLMRWAISAGRLGRNEEAKQVMNRIVTERGGEVAGKSAVLALMNDDHAELGLELAQIAHQQQPEWSWPGNVIRLGSMKQQENKVADLLEEAEQALGQGRVQEAITKLETATSLNPNSPQVLLCLARAQAQVGMQAEAEVALIKGLNAHPGHAWAWLSLADISFQRKDYVGAAGCYRRFLQQKPGDETAKSKLEICLKTQAPPTVAQKPPSLVVFLVGGLTPELVRMPAPHLLIGTAWGEFLAETGPQPDAANWASLYTGVPPYSHGLNEEINFERPLSTKNLNTPTFWEVINPKISVGLASVPLTTPPPEVNGWALAGFPGGLLSPQLVQPAELTPRVLATGYRTDFALSEFELQTAPQRLESDIRQEGLLLQQERNKLTAATNLPAVDLLVIGLNVLEYIQTVRELASYQMYSAYQQVYGWIETFLAGVQPKAFAIFSQRGYPREGHIATLGGFYCMSWLRGESGKANITDVAGEIVKYFGGDPNLLGQPKL
jgi:glycosyltransferase involved in cell wall biosynthesis